MKAKVVIIGAKGHTKVIIDILRSRGRYNIVGCTNVMGTGEDIEGVQLSEMTPVYLYFLIKVCNSLY